MRLRYQAVSFGTGQSAGILCDWGVNHRPRKHGVKGVLWPPTFRSGGSSNAFWPPLAVVIFCFLALDRRSCPIIIVTVISLQLTWRDKSQQRRSPAARRRRPPALITGRLHRRSIYRDPDRKPIILTFHQTYLCQNFFELVLLRPWWEILSAQCSFVWQFLCTCITNVTAHLINWESALA